MDSAISKRCAVRSLHFGRDDIHLELLGLEPKPDPQGQDSLLHIAVRGSVINRPGPFMMVIDRNTDSPIVRNREKHKTDRFLIKKSEATLPIFRKRSEFCVKELP